MKASLSLLELLGPLAQKVLGEGGWLVLALEIRAAACSTPRLKAQSVAIVSYCKHCLMSRPGPLLGWCAVQCTRQRALTTEARLTSPAWLSTRTREPQTSLLCCPSALPQRAGTASGFLPLPSTTSCCAEADRCILPCNAWISHCLLLPVLIWHMRCPCSQHDRPKAFKSI